MAKYGPFPALLPCGLLWLAASLASLWDVRLAQLLLAGEVGAGVTAIVAAAIYP